jgi:hypothetical protein
MVDKDCRSKNNNSACFLTDVEESDMLTVLRILLVCHFRIDVAAMKAVATRSSMADRGSMTCWVDSGAKMNRMNQLLVL